MDGRWCVGDLHLHLHLHLHMQMQMQMQMQITHTPPTIHDFVDVFFYGKSKMVTKPFKIGPFEMSLRLSFFFRVCSDGTSPRG